MPRSENKRAALHVVLVLRRWFRVSFVRKSFDETKKMKMSNFIRLPKIHSLRFYQRFHRNKVSFVYSIEPSEAFFTINYDFSNLPSKRFVILINFDSKMIHEMICNLYDS